ncbi:MAG: HAMP domain-containing histidine kinase [Acidobacteria bacterium]|nr:HAMP domain-containing histidine kinase [Acidobacteriota bacterium]MBI3424252.1 HAMP domain-containing histidine kinase [Acidobacteriota bacterium]
MRRLQFNLFTKILLWSFLNLLVLGTGLLIFINLQYRLSPLAIFQGEGNERLEGMLRLLGPEVNDKPHAERDAVLKRFSDAYQAEFLLVANTGEQLGGPAMALPADLLADLKLGPPRQPPGPKPNIHDEKQGPPVRLRFMHKTANPTRYWFGLALGLAELDKTEMTRATLVVVSDSRSAHGLFFSAKPWLLMAACVAALSILLWLPFVRRLTRAVAQLTTATEQIADEHFDVRVNERRTDELGRLGKAINHLAVRLSGFVQGQKRFLGDVSHELNSPLARMQFALSILEQRATPDQCAYIADVQEEVELMSRLVSELLAFSKAGMRGPAIKLEPVRLRPLIAGVIEREANQELPINVEVDAALNVTAQPELLARAVSNLLRNALRYAGTSGPITVAATQHDNRVNLSVRDCGPGVPAEALHKIFDPFYRLEADRARVTGGAGLGLAIVKSCVETCQGSVAAHNLQPVGFEVAISLKAA